MNTSVHLCKIPGQQKENMCYLVPHLILFMKFRVLSIVSVLFFYSATAFGQQKLLTMEEAVIKQRTTLAPDKLLQLQWIKGTNQFSYIVKKEGKEQLIREDASTLVRDTVITIDDFKILFKTLEMDIAPPERFPVITWMDKDQFRFMHANAFYQINVKTKVAAAINKLPKNAEDLEFEPVTSKVAFTESNNVVVYDKTMWLNLIQNKPKADMNNDPAYLSKDGTYGIVNGKSVHRNEFGITKGLFWSPMGNRLAYYKMNEMIVTNYSLMNFETKPGTFENIKYPMAGAMSHTVRVFIQDFAKGRQYEVQTNAQPDQYLTNVSWSPGEEFLYIAVVNRDQNEMKLNQYDGRSGVFIKTMFTETSPKYVEPEHPVTFVNNDESRFVWFSKRDGFNQLYLYDFRGKLQRQLTTAKNDVTELIGFDKGGKYAYYIAATNNGLDRQCFSVELATGKTKQLTMVPGVHSVVMSEDGNYLLDTYSNASIPRKTVLMDKAGAELAVLLNAINPIAGYSACKMSIGSIPAADKVTPLNYRMFYPPQFDSTKQYPVIVYLYGGPHVQLVTNSWLGGSDMWLYYMAQQGYVVFTIDNRGSGNRGAEFEQAIFRKVGNIERADQMEGVAFLKKQSYVDASRMGIFGWSFGGFMSVGMMTRQNVFKAGVAGGPVIDWSMYEIMYTERYMDKPKDNPEGYKDADLTNYAKDLKGKLLIIHGTDDDVVLWQHSLTYLKKCVDEGVQVDYFVYPEHKHNVLGKDRVHLMQKVADYFKQNL
jgi:dipeptidyl-peptidase-4